MSVYQTYIKKSRLYTVNDLRFFFSSMYTQYCSFELLKTNIYIFLLLINSNFYSDTFAIPSVRKIQFQTECFDDRLCARAPYRFNRIRVNRNYQKKKKNPFTTDWYIIYFKNSDFPKNRKRVPKCIVLVTTICHEKKKKMYNSYKRMLCFPIARNCRHDDDVTTFVLHLIRFRSKNKYSFRLLIKPTRVSVSLFPFFFFQFFLTVCTHIC